MIVNDDGEAAVRVGWMRVGWMRFGVLVVGSALLAGCTSGGAQPSPTVSSLEGRWTLARFTVEGNDRVLSATDAGTVTFGPRSTISADDSVNGMSGSYELRGNRLRVGTVTTTLVGVSPTSPAANTVAAIEVVLGGDGGHPVMIGLRDGRLVVSSGREQVEFRR